MLNMSATLMEVANRTDKNGAIPDIVEMLAEDNEILQDMMWMECNEGTTHTSTIRTGLPKAVWRAYNMGVPTGRSTTKKITDNTAMLEVRSKIDCKLVDINTNKQAYRNSEDMAFLEGMSQQVAKTIFYGSKKDTKEFIGFTERYDDPTAESGKNIIDGGGTGSDNTSIWVICWGDRASHGLYPKGSKAGFQQEDKGVQTVQDDDGNDFDAYVTKYSWDPGLCVRDWRYAVRIANIDVSDLSGASAANIIDLLIKAIHKIPRNRAGMRMSIYCREEVFTALDLQTLNKANAALCWKELQGKEVLSFRNIPIRKVDQLLATEARVEGIAA